MQVGLSIAALALVLLLSMIAYRVYARRERERRRSVKYVFGVVQPANGNRDGER